MTDARIGVDPAVAFGKPVIAGTRIAVETILEEFGAGESLDTILENHPHLTRDQVLAALDFAKEAVNAMPSQHRDRTSNRPDTSAMPAATEATGR